jgi:hypothetical protein
VQQRAKLHPRAGTTTQRQQTKNVQTSQAEYHSPSSPDLRTTRRQRFDTAASSICNLASALTERSSTNYDVVDRSNKNDAQVSLFRKWVAFVFRSLALPDGRTRQTRTRVSSLSQCMNTCYKYIPVAKLAMYGHCHISYICHMYCMYFDTYIQGCLINYFHIYICTYLGIHEVIYYI